MATVTFRMSDGEKEAWVEAAGGSRQLSEWLREKANRALTERGVVAAAPNDRDITNLAAESTVTAAPRSVSARPFTPDFKKPVAVKPGRR